MQFSKRVDQYEAHPRNEWVQQLLKIISEHLPHIPQAPNFLHPKIQFSENSF